jgi:hypothetical protein
VAVGVSVLVRVGLAVGLAVGTSETDVPPINEQACMNKAASTIKLNFRICSLIHAMILRTHANLHFYFIAMPDPPFSPDLSAYHFVALS